MEKIFEVPLKILESEALKFLDLVRLKFSLKELVKTNEMILKDHYEEILKTCRSSLYFSDNLTSNSIDRLSNRDLNRSEDRPKSAQSPECDF